ncbi:MAG TPA: T9SS type A sorting domain-containing protein, partial [Candidatus Kapabacteria bacterium]|nr:T9SS type A sorting domain-containing protein [Candidatus Kapabacteria bacterium]
GNDTISSHNPYRIAFSGSKSAEQNVGTLSTPVVQAAPGDTIVVPVILQSTNSVAGIRLTMHIRYNASVLLPLSATGGTIDSIGTGIAIFTSDGSNTTDTITQITFLVALGDSAISSITFDTLLSGICPVAFSQTGGGVQLTGLCQQGGTRLFVANGQIALMQNAPNPFSSATDIVYSTIENGETRLTISNILGQTVAVLVDNSVPPGKHTVHFDASNLSSGMYYYTLQTPTQLLRRAMIIEK